MRQLSCGQVQEGAANAYKGINKRVRTALHYETSYYRTWAILLDFAVTLGYILC